MTEGPLAGVRVVELASLGPGPFAAMMLADLGADVIRVDRLGAPSEQPERDVVLRNRRSIAVDLKSTAGRDVVLGLVAGADAIVEGFRPGVAERLGLGPEQCHARNPRLVYGRMTGWGQDGPLSASAGHDITYLAVTGVLWGSRRVGERPVPSMNLLGDLGGGAAFLAFGIVSALLHARTTGEGQIVDASIVDGTAAMSNFIRGLREQGLWSGEPGTNLLDTGAPFYDTYVCSDGKEIAVGALEPQFYAELVRLTEAANPSLDPAQRGDPSTWPAARRDWATLFATRTRDEWAALLEGTDACAAPVLSWDEAAQHPHLVARGTFVEVDGVVQAVPAPRFSGTPAVLSMPPMPPTPPTPPRRVGADTDELLAELGRSAAEIAQLRGSGAVG